MPSDFCLSRRAPAGRSYDQLRHLRRDRVGIEYDHVGGVAFAQQPASRQTPVRRPGTKVILRIACSSVSACFSRTQ